MNAVVELKPFGGALAQAGQDRMAVAEIIGHVARVQEVMRAVMKENVHYGKIPGTDKPTLLKPGAEVLCMAFRIGDEYRVEDLSTADMIRYRVTCIGRHQNTGVELGSGIGEASSSEEKYKWRRAVCVEEFNDTPAHLRRKKYGKSRGGGHYVQEQVRTEPADMANTVLKMAAKRAKMAMVLNVTAASDCFNQDLEDMDEAMRDHLARHPDEAHGGQQDGSGQQAPQAQQQAALPDFTEEHLQQRAAKIRDFYAAGKSADEIIAFYSLKASLSDAMKKRIRDMAPAAAAADAGGPAVTYAQVADRIAKATSHAELDEAEDLTRNVADAGQRDELAQLLANKRTSVA